RPDGAGGALHRQPQDRPARRAGPEELRRLPLRLHRSGALTMRDADMTTRDIRHEGMRIGGEKVFTDRVIEVRYPYTGEVVGTVPAGTAEHARRAFEIAANYRARLTRYERSQILKRAGEIIGERRD